MLSTINSLKSIKSNHEHQIMKYFSATLCHNVVLDGIIKLSKKKKKSVIEILMAYLD